MGLRIQVLGLSYFSIDLVRELLRHTLWSSGSVFTRRVAHLLFLLLRFQACPSLIVAQSGGGDGFFISSVEDSVLERYASLESLCFGIRFGRLELNCNYNFYITVLCFYIVLAKIPALRGHPGSKWMEVEEGDLIQIHKEVGRHHGGGPQDGSKPQTWRAPSLGGGVYEVAPNMTLTFDLDLEKWCAPSEGRGPSSCQVWS